MGTTSKARTGETQLNMFLAKALDRRHPRWKATAEQTRTVRGEAGLRPDILIINQGGQPLIIETEVLPAATVEQDAASRLGVTLDPGGERVEQVIALRIPSDLTFVDQAILEDKIETSVYQYAALSLHADGTQTRWPQGGWLEGGIDDLASLCENISLSEQTLTAGLTRLEEAARDISYRMRTTVPQEVLDQIAEELRQEDGEQTSLMAAAIILNAATFHTAIAGHHNICTIDQLRDTNRKLRQSKVLGCWHRIITEVNYLPIFHIAYQIVQTIPTDQANRILEQAAEAAEDLAGIGVTTMHDLAGRMFQQLISDRKFLATFYTLPPSAAMLSELAVSKLNTNWADTEAVTNLRVADLACGTGTLLSAAYQTIRSRYRLAGGDDADIHSKMMESSLIGADVMPQAAHLTASMLSSAHPSIPFGNTRVYTMPYGGDNGESGDITIGSLELLDNRGVETLFAVGEQMVHGRGKEGRQKDMLLPHGTSDLVIMNPPFTSPTNHTNTAVPVPSFAGLGTGSNEQRLMSKKLKVLRRGLERAAGDGNAGLGSDFFDLADAKLAEGGVLAIVLLFTSLRGQSWHKLRKKLSTDYTDITIVSISAHGKHDRAFSADTGVAEVVIVAVKNTGNGDGCSLYINLRQRPESIPEAIYLARLATMCAPNSQHGYLTTGKNRSGVWFRGDIIQEGGIGGLSEPSVAAAITSLPKGKLVLPRTEKEMRIPMTTLSLIGQRGLIGRDIGFHPEAKGSPRGPFVIHPIEGVPEYPMLWGGDGRCERERFLVVAPDHQGIIRDGMKKQAIQVWEQVATRLHFNLDFQLNSQSLATCITHEPVISGGAWPSFNPGSERWVIPILLWSNTTLGLMCFWWTGSRQQQGRSRLPITAQANLPVLDPRRLDFDQINQADSIFDSLRGREFLPANEAYRDKSRQELDRAVLIDLLGLPEDVLGPLDVLRKQWCAEPSVHGGKSTRPPV